MTESPDLAIIGGVVVNPDWTGQADVYVKDGVISSIVQGGDGPPDRFGGIDEVVDASGRLVMPGGVDPHCHVGFTSGEFTTLDGYREATIAAVMGGTTTIVDFAIPEGDESPIDAARRQVAKAADGICDSALHGCVVDWDDSIPDQLNQMADLGIRTVKMFTTYRGETMANEDTILAVMGALSEHGGMVVVHCEANHLIEHAQALSLNRDEIGASHHHETRPELAEEASVAWVLAIAESLDVPVYFVHQSTGPAVDLVSEAKRRGVKAYSEVVAHHVCLSDEVYARSYAEMFVCCPPLRSAETVAGLTQRLLLGDVDTIGSDHCCYDTAQKIADRDDVRAMPNGLPGVETRLPVVYDQTVVANGMDPRRFVQLTATGPARLNGLYPGKGIIAPGSDADLALWDINSTRTIRSSDLSMATDYTPFEGRQVGGWPTTVIVRGRVVVDGGRLQSDALPNGRHLHAGPVI